LVHPYSSRAFQGYPRAQQGAPLVRRSQWEIEHDKHTTSSIDGDTILIRLPTPSLTFLGLTIVCTRLPQEDEGILSVSDGSP